MHKLILTQGRHLFFLTVFSTSISAYEEICPDNGLSLSPQKKKKRVALQLPALPDTESSLVKTWVWSNSLPVLEPTFE